MAIFGKADAALPLITQVMQVNPHNEQELLELWRRTEAIALLKNVERIAPEIREKAGRSFSSDEVLDVETDVRDDNLLTNVERFSLILEAAGKSGLEPAQYLLFRFGVICDALQELISAYYETSKTTEGLVSLEHLQALRAESAWFQWVLGVTFAATYEGTLVPPSEVAIKLNAIQRAPTVVLAQEVEQFFYDLYHQKAHLGQCPVCGNIFVSENRRQVYCSSRDAWRARNGRRVNNLLT